MNHGRFTDCFFLRAIGRNLLKEFFDKFEVALPPSTVSDDEFFTSISRLLMAPEGLPDRINDVLYEIQELSTATGHDRLKRAVDEDGLQLSPDGTLTPGELALRVWLNRPDMLAKKYNEHRFSRLKGFVCYERDAGCLALGNPTEQRDNEDDLVAYLDAWFGDNGRGEHTAVVEKYVIAGEDWYLIRHGDTYLRSSRIENRKVEVLHYRPAKDDLVVYNPKRDELRINAKTKGERELYRAAFGQYLHGFENYFRSTNTLCLDPLRDLGADSLECHDIPGITKVVLTQLDLAFDDDEQASTAWKATDLFASRFARDAKALELPQEASLKEAAFHIFVGDSAEPLKVRIIPPNTICLGNKQSAAPVVQDWLFARGFRARGGDIQPVSK